MNYSAKQILTLQAHYLLVPAASIVLEIEQQAGFYRGNNLKAEGATALSEILECAPGITYLDIRCSTNALSHSFV
jgi:hypothetical protein